MIFTSWCHHWLIPTSSGLVTASGFCICDYLLWHTLWTALPLSSSVISLDNPLGCALSVEYSASWAITFSFIRCTDLFEKLFTKTKHGTSGNILLRLVRIFFFLPRITGLIRQFIGGSLWTQQARMILISVVSPPVGRRVFLHGLVRLSHSRCHSP